VALATTGDDDFHRKFGHTALERPGPAGMRRNAGLLLGRASEPG
jgi:epoxyqueuosine reductase QueG